MERGGESVKQPERGVDDAAWVMRHRRLALGGVLLLALVLRVLFLVLAGVDAPPVGDELAYQQIAENFAAGRGLFQTNNPFFPGQSLYAWQAPLYPLLLGLLYSVLGQTLLLAKAFGILVSTATVYVTYALAFRVSRSMLPRSEPHSDTVRTPIALVAAFLVAIYPGLLTHAHLLLSETLFIFLLLLAFACLAHAFESKARVRWWLLGAGVVWGLATLTRGLTLYFTPLLALWVGWMLWRGMSSEQSRAGESSHSSRAALVGAGLVLLGVVVTIVPWTVRNYTQFGQPVVLETKGGVNLWLGNSPYTPDDFIRNVWKVGIREPMLDGLPQDEVQRDRAAYAAALGYIREQPLVFVARMPLKFADLWGFERNLIDNAGATRAGAGWNSAVKLGADVLAASVYIFVVLTGGAGFIFEAFANKRSLRDPWQLLFGGFILYFVAAHLVIFGDGRFHLPLIPLLALYAAWLLVLFRRIEFATAPVAVTLVIWLLLVSVWVREAAAAVQVLRGG